MTDPVVVPHVIAAGADRGVPEGKFGEGDAGVHGHDVRTVVHAFGADYVPPGAVVGDIGLCVFIWWR